MEINVDIGGTFTDCVVTGDGSDGPRTAKALTTHHDLAIGFFRAIEAIASACGLDVDALLADTETIRYATTLGTNALIERNGPRLGLLTTAGHEHTVPIGRCRQWADGLPAQVARDLPRARRPEPLVEPEQIAVLTERVDAYGRILIPLREDEVIDRVQDLVDQGVRGFVVSLLNSHVNAEHERRVREIIESEYPSTYLGRFPVILTHEIARRSGEYARTMTATINAYLHRFTADRLSRLRDELRSRGYRGELLLVHNSGGMGTLASTAPIHTVHAGPVSGLYGSRHVAAAHGFDKVVTTDMGGTSFDVGMVVAGSVRFYDFHPVIDRWRVQVPMMDISAIGAGGGSIARLDPVVGIVVGPESAGSNPGPACYGQGGTEPTVTDADVVLGYLDPKHYHGGKLTLDVRRAERAIERRIARPLGISVSEAALRIRRVVDETMGSELFKLITTKGYDPQEFTVFSFGGGGPLHACGYASSLRTDQVVVPPHSEVFSATGAAGLERLHIYEQSVWQVLFNPLTKHILTDYAVFNSVVEEFESRAQQDFGGQGFASDEVKTTIELDMRSTGQLFVITIACPVSRLRGPADVAEIIRAYFDEYGDRFGDLALTREVGVSIDAVRLRAWIPREPEQARKRLPGVAPADVTAAWTGSRSCVWRDGPAHTDVYAYAALQAGHRVDGPAIVEAADTTIVVEPGWFGEMDEYGYFRMRQENPR
ncbi:hydantoinase/oxoprolinase family protein [[Mycobacterium] wendilense]|uniref:Hydantoinase/oxoprolinase family protein n=1 Tax=[Mycobacterium] wendilense TaxID=3064284 RepID=A0ABN9NZP3_9MYCO|nr:hydantoinase/oxoprolinase family protein [Mycolicibacterium sp. MU0050]CAJ1583541.1 hydantoinase/oxoprolinase family protein [Mycolicibacterium sp. MU0050]